jgi:hypothetical protein
MRRISLEGGIEVATFDRPPEDFDPLTASTAELEKYGLPAMPDDPRHRERYRNLLSRLKGKLKFVEPKFRAATPKSNAGPSASAAGSAGGASPQGHPSAVGTSSNWSGGVVYPPEGQSFQWVQGEWTVPPRPFPIGTGCCSWIGIDGNSNSNALMAGVVSTWQVVPDPFNPPSQFFWCWLPQGAVFWFALYEIIGGEFVIYTINPGDAVSFIIESEQGAGSTSATILVADLSSGHVTTFAVSGEPTMPLLGSSAEWIVSSEIGVRDSGFGGLGPYGEVLFTNCEAVTAPGSITVGGGAGDSIDMIDGGQVVSQGILVNATTVKCLYGPPPSPLFCQDLLQTIDDRIGGGKHLPVTAQELLLWERELAACLSEGKISPAQYASALGLIQSHQV